MYRNLTYLILFTVTLLLQAFLFDNLTISVYLNPLVYIALVLLLPFETPRGVLLLAGLASGLAADWEMGVAGINTISTVLLAFLRPTLLDLLVGKETVRDGGVPSPERLNNWVFLRYLLVTVVLHHFVFFLLESLSWVYLWQTLLRLVVSSSVTIACMWLAAKIITPKLTTRL